MFFLITGASGMGKSTVRAILAKEFEGLIETAELIGIAGSLEWDSRWRHRAVERAVQRALAAQRSGRHFTLSSDPVPPGELFAVPSAPELDGIAVCLLDATPEEQIRRLAKRGEDPVLFPRHVAFADWMREHLTNPGHMPEVIMQNGWEEMRWDRWVGLDGSEVPWAGPVIDTTNRPPVEVARLVSGWIRQHICPAN